MLVCNAFTVAQTASAQATSAHTTLVIFADRPISGQLWLALTAELHAELASGDPEMRTLDPEAQFLRGESLVPGIEFHATVTVFLHGPCTTIIQTGIHPASIPGALGWVNSRKGSIEPFMHVNCTLIARMLASQSAWSPQPNQKMATALARVILHEWIHIATQNPAHAHHGVAQAQFSIYDLVALPASSPNPAVRSHGGR
jgi:hypothetical protein